ncbi:protein phosphatase 2C domain-containing protein [Streptomyces sp. NRRL S-118]|uniref:protein phosphatase 2C domain-containing protein n=1 Tax=Streptomyces sp. NRRL S-118 TaxID=1463881 RepID=UPI0004C58E40|nr:protein phosphatase 2C domain-containing protein [Streptomyces sp. NRRL S-118]
MHTEISCVPGDPERPNEDWASVAVPASGRGGAVIVLDGVTPLEGDVGCVHPVPWFTARLGGTLTELSASRADLTLTDILAEAIRRTADAHRATCDLSHVRTPQATVVLARWDTASLEHLVLSDSVLLLESADGSVRAVRDDRLDRLPPGALATQAIADATVRNREGGFFTAAADPSVAARAVTGRTPLREVRALAALTDGATRWTERFAAGDWADCFGVLRKEGPRGLIALVRALETADAEGTAGAAGAVEAVARTRLRRRGKRHDDATAVYVEL